MLCSTMHLKFYACLLPTIFILIENERRRPRRQDCTRSNLACGIAGLQFLNVMETLALGHSFYPFLGQI
jgi:hypothetical protein